MIELRASDFFLRRVAKRSVLKDVVGAGAFSDNHATLSFTFQEGELKTERGLIEYQVNKALPSGDLPGLCKVSFANLTSHITPPLPPRHDPIAEDKLYGHLHFITDKPSELQREQLAKLATKHGVIRSHIKKNKAAEVFKRLEELGGQALAD